MRNARFEITLLIVYLFISNPIVCSGEEYWQQFVQYKIYAKLNTQDHSISGYEELLYQNNSPDTLSELYFHLYPNAFQEHSVMAREAASTFMKLITSPEETGWIKIDSLAIIKLTLDRQPVHCDTLIDDTILKIKLSPHLFAGEQLRIFIKFRTKIRKFNNHGGKGGYLKDFYEVSQWYPKICVYNQKGWNVIKYHWLGEFYGEFGTFAVTLNVPDSFIVAATGTVVSGDPGWEHVKVDSNCKLPQDSGSKSHAPNAPRSFRKNVTFYAENVHDFMWVASPDYLYQTANWHNIPIHILFRRSSHQRWCNVAVRNTKEALKWWFGLVADYPYPHITVCEALTPGGMEYPMIIVLGNPDLTLFVHEMGHMYFYGAVANNEQEEGWLDEGLVTYQSQYYNDINNPHQSQNIAPSLNILPFRKIMTSYQAKDIQLNSLYYYLNSGFAKPLATECYQLRNRYLYSYNVYVMPAKFFAMLDYVIGHENFNKTIKTYYEQWKFKHVDGQKFQAVCESVTGTDLDWFFKQWIYHKPYVDYALTDMVSRRQANGAWQTDIAIQQLGTGIMPIEAEAITVAGDTIRQRCLGEKRRIAMTFHTPTKIKTVQLDPDDMILDQNRLNNSTPKVRIFSNFDFPSMYYLPRDAYSLFLWPRFWYNDIDGFKPGISIISSYLNRYYVTRTYLGYGLRSGQIDVSFNYSMPWEKINRNLWRHLSYSKVEGRTEFNLNVHYNKAKRFADSQMNSIRFGFSHQRVIDDRYCFRIIQSGEHTIKFREWDPGTLNKFYCSVQTDNHYWWIESHLEVNGDLSNKAWQSAFNYNRLSLLHQLRLGSNQKNWKFNLRTFMGYSFPEANQLPIQDQFWVAEGNPIRRFKYIYLRSPGSLPAWMYYHFPGDGNLTGYVNKLIQGHLPLASRQLITANIQFVHRNLHRILPNNVEKLVQGIDFTAFIDGGRVWIRDLDRNYLFDAGIGLRIYMMILRKQRILNINFPFWLSAPELDQFSPSEPPWKFRWVVSLQ